MKKKLIPTEKIKELKQSLILTVIIYSIIGVASAFADEAGNVESEPQSETILQPMDVGNVIKFFPAPAGSPGGDAWINGYLIHADYGNNTIYKISPIDGSVVSSFSSPYTYGLAFDGTYLWGSDILSNVIAKMDPSNGTVISSFSAPGSGSLGLAWDGTYLWHVDWVTNTIYKIDPSDGSVVSSFSSPNSRPFGLTWDGSTLWVATRDADMIWQIDPSDGSVLDSFPAPNGNPEGLAWDGQHLWNSDYITDMIYQIDVGFASASVYYGLSPCRLVDSRIATVSEYQGPLLVDTPFHFSAKDSSEILKQGGSSGGCGVPPEATALVLNVTAAKPMSGNGNLVVYAYGASKPTASLVNFSGNDIANSTTLQICNFGESCDRDFSIVANNNSAQVIIDVMGFFAPLPSN